MALTKVRDAGMPAGAVLQVVEVKIAGEQTTTTQDTWFSLADSGGNNLTASITPTSTNSKILVKVNGFTKFHTGNVGNAGLIYIDILRGSTSITPATLGFQVLYSYNNTTNRQSASYAVEQLDSPSSTSSVTYNVNIRFDGAQTFYYGLQDSIILMEIAG